MKLSNIEFYKIILEINTINYLQKNIGTANSPSRCLSNSAIPSAKTTSFSSFWISDRLLLESACRKKHLYSKSSSVDVLRPSRVAGLEFKRLENGQTDGPARLHRFSLLGAHRLLLADGRVRSLIRVEEAKIFTVFILPLNSCCNPFLYAIQTK